jgi:hypothetical protein
LSGRSVTEASSEAFSRAPKQSTFDDAIPAGRLDGRSGGAYYRSLMSRPTILAILSLPAAAIGYAVGVAILSALPLPEGLADLLLIFVPLLIAGLCMVPFLVPFVDRMAKRDLEAHRAASAAADRAPRDPDAPKD